VGNPAVALFHTADPLAAESLATTHTAQADAAEKSSPERLTPGRMVEVSIVATDANGAPAEGLNAADFRAWDNGTEQTIAGFQKIGSAADSTPAALPPYTCSDGAGKPGEPQFLSMVLLDAVNTKFRDQVLAWRAVENVVKQLPPDEPVAIYSFGSGFGIRIIHDFPADTGPLLAMLGAYRSGVPGSDDKLKIRNLVDKERPSAPDRPAVFRAFLDKERILNTLAALETIADRVKGVPGRKNLLWVSAAIPLVAGNQRSVYFEQFEPQLKRAAAALNNAHVSVYPIDASGLSINPNIGTMITIADATGGKAFYNRNDIATGVRAALDDSREMYVLTYAPQPLVADGAHHTIKVASSRRGVRLRYRQGYDAPSRVESASAEAERRLTEVVSSPPDAPATGIQARVEPGQGEGDDVSVAIHIDSAALNLVPSAGRWTGALRLEAMQLGAAGELLGGVSQAAEINLEPATYQRALRQGLPFEMKLPRDPAAVAVRIGVVDEHGGHAGSLSVRLPPQR